LNFERDEIRCRSGLALRRGASGRDHRALERKLIDATEQDTKPIGAWFRVKVDGSDIEWDLIVPTEENTTGTCGQVPRGSLLARDQRDDEVSGQAELQIDALCTAVVHLGTTLAIVLRR
jgi:hypothetical protein